MFNPYFQNLQNYGTQAQNYIPYNTPYNAPQGSNNQLIRVTGIDGAKAYQMAANSTVALFDSNEDIMYVKTTDGAGFGTIRALNEFSATGNINTMANVENALNEAENVSESEFGDIRPALNRYNTEKSLENFERLCVEIEEFAKRYMLKLTAKKKRIFL